MHIALGAELLDFPRSGMRIALEGFLRAAVHLGKADLFDLIHGAPFERGAFAEFTDTVVLRPGSPASGLRWSQRSIPQALGHKNIDLLHWPCQLLPPINPPAPMVVSVWDIAPMLFNEPTWSHLQVFVKYKRVLHRALNNADRVIAHSRAIAEDITTHFHIPAEKITVIYPSVSERFEKEIERPHSPIGEGPLLYVGTNSTRKNLGLLLKAFGILVKQGVNNRLALRIDADERQMAKLRTSAEQAGIPKERIDWHGPLDLAELMQLYRQASVFAFPSLYEGFGMPLLEALAVGLPVTALNQSAMSEVTGEAGLLVDENNAEAFAAGLLEALRLSRDEGPETASRAKKQAGMFKWTKAVQETICVYEQVLGKDA